MPVIIDQREQRQRAGNTQPPRAPPFHYIPGQTPPSIRAGQAPTRLNLTPEALYCHFIILPPRYYRSEKRPFPTKLHYSFDKGFIRAPLVQRHQLKPSPYLYPLLFVTSGTEKGACVYTDHCDTPHCLIWVSRVPCTYLRFGA